jgi:hypothetical protein
MYDMYKDLRSFNQVHQVLQPWAIYISNRLIDLIVGLIIYQFESRNDRMNTYVARKLEPRFFQKGKIFQVFSFGHCQKWGLRSDFNFEPKNVKINLLRTNWIRNSFKRAKKSKFSTGHGQKCEIGFRPEIMFTCLLIHLIQPRHGKNKWSKLHCP